MANAGAALTVPAATARGWIWPGAVVGLLAAQVMLGAGTAYLALRDPAHTVTPGYHAKALAWESEARLRAASAALGWRAGAELRKTSGGWETVVRLVERDGTPVAGANVRVTAFHHARGGEPFVLELAARAPGVYAAAFPGRKSGLWELRLRAERDAERFVWTDVRERELEAAP